MKKQNAIEEISKLELKKEASIGQDYVDNKLIYGVKINDVNYILTSNKEFVRLEDFEKELGIKPRHTEVELSRIEPSTIINFTKNENNNYLSPEDLFLLIKLNIKEYVFFEDEKNYDVLALWIILSYCYTLFTHVPYLHLKGDKGAGKSTLLSILKNTCFNATMWSNMTEAVIFRYIDISNATLLLDEVEDLKNPKNKGLTGILNAGFNKEGTVPRTKMTKNSEKVIQYNAYSMKAIAGINDIPNVLKDRCINIQMAKKPKSVKLSKYINTSKEIVEKNNIIIQNLYIFALLYCNDIYKIYENMEIDLPECLSSRDIDIYLPLFCIAKFIDKNSLNINIEKSLYEYAENMSMQRNKQDIEENLSYKLISDLYIMIKENNVKPYMNNLYVNNDIYSYLNYSCDYNFSTITSLTKAMNNLQIEHRRITINGNKITCYIITIEQLEKLIDSYNITIPESMNNINI